MKIRSKATLTLRAMLARRYGFGASPNKPPLCHLWPQRHCLLSLYRIQYKRCYTEKIVIPNSLPEPNLLRTSFQEFGITFLSLAVFPMQKCFEYH